MLLWPILRLILFFVVAFIAYVFGFRRYEKHLYREYGYKLTGVPTVIAMLCYLAASASSLIGIQNPMFDGSPIPEQLAFAFLIGAPGIGLATLQCLIKTRRPVLALINIPILYVYSFLAGYTFVFFIMLIFTGAIGGGMLRGIAAGGGRRRPMTNTERIEHNEYWSPRE